MCPKRIALCLLSLISLAVTYCNDVIADPLEVISKDSGDRIVLDLKEGERGRLVVYLRSFGDEMAGYTIELIDDLNRAVATQISTPIGVIQFDGLPPGRFRIRANPEGKKSLRGVKNPVAVSDFRLTKVNVPAEQTKK